MKRIAAISALFAPGVIFATVTCGGTNHDGDDGSSTIDSDGGKTAVTDGSSGANLDATMANTNPSDDGSALSTEAGSGSEPDDDASDANPSDTGPLNDVGPVVCQIPADGGAMLTYVKTITPVPSGSNPGIQGLEIYGTRLYTFGQDYSSLIYILDLSQPETLATIGSVTAAGGTGRFLYDDGTYFYVGANYTGVELFNRADASAPISTVTGTQAYGVAATYPHAYAASAPGGGSAVWFQAITYATPASASAANLTWDASGSAAEDRATAVTTNGTVAYVNFTVSDLRVVDISNPQAPVQVGSVSLPSPSSGINCVDRINRPLLDATRGLLMVPRCGHGVSILNVSTPASPTVLSSTDNPSCETTDLYAALSGTKLITHNGTTIRIYDVSTAASPKVLGVTTAEANMTGDVRVGPDGTHVYIATAAGVAVYTMPN